MVIHNKGVHNIVRAYDRQGGTPKVKPSPGAEPPKRKDRVTLSSEAKEIHTIQRAAGEAPDVRADKVAALRQAIAEGRYEVPAKEVARKMLQHGLSEGPR